MSLDGLTFCSVAAVDFSCDPDTLFVDAGKRCPACHFHTSMRYPLHCCILVSLGWIILGRGGVIVHVHAVAGLQFCPLVTVGACVVAAEGGVLRLVV